MANGDEEEKKEEENYAKSDKVERNRGKDSDEHHNRSNNDVKRDVPYVDEGHGGANEDKYEYISNKRGMERWREIEKEARKLYELSFQRKEENTEGKEWKSDKTTVQEKIFKKQNKELVEGNKDFKSDRLGTIMKAREQTEEEIEKEAMELGVEGKDDDDWKWNSKDWKNDEMKVQENIFKKQNKELEKENDDLKIDEHGTIMRERGKTYERIVKEAMELGMEKDKVGKNGKDWNWNSKERKNNEINGQENIRKRVNKQKQSKKLEKENKNLKRDKHGTIMRAREKTDEEIEKEAMELWKRGMEEDKDSTDDEAWKTDEEIQSEDELEMVKREEWGAKSVSPGKPLDLPVPKVWFIYSTETKPCHTKEQCIRSMREIQEYSLNSKRLSDLPYNFLIGGDGKVYEGRGWDVQTPGSKTIPTHNGRRLDIGYIGNYKRHNLSLKLIKGGLDVVTFGIVRKYIQRTFRCKEWVKIGKLMPHGKKIP